MRSRSTFGLSLITLVFRDGTEDYWSRQRIMERIQNCGAAAGTHAGRSIRSPPPLVEIYKYTLESDTKGLRELSETPEMDRDPGVEAGAWGRRYRNFGGITTQFQLELDPQQLMRFNLSLKNVTDAISANSANSGGSVLTRGELGLRHPRHRSGPDARRHGQHRRHPAQRNANPGARSRQAEARATRSATASWARRQERRDRGSRPAAARRKPVARDGGRPRQGRGTQ